jgi:hypothetical protein
MKATFHGGPAFDLKCELSRTPIYLRIAIDEHGEARAMDKPSEIRKTLDRIYAYRRVTMTGEAARYEFCADQPTRDDTDTNASWEAWTAKRIAQDKAGAS